MEEKVQGKIYDGRILRRLLPYAWPYRGMIGLSLLLLVLQTMAQVATPLFTQVAIDKYISRKVEGFDSWLAFLNPYLPGDAVEGIGFISMVFALVLGFKLLCEYAQQIAMQWTGQRIMFDLRRDIYSHLQRMDIAYFDRNPVGRVLTRVTSDVDQLNEFFAAALVTMLGDIMILGAILAAMFQLNWQLTLIMCSALPFVAVTTMIFRKHVQTGYREQRVAIAKLNAFLSEYLNGMSVVQLFNHEKRAKEDFEAINRENMNAWKGSIVAYGWFYPVVEFQGFLAMGGLLAWGGMQIESGGLTVGVLVAFLQYAMRFFGPIQDLSEKYNTVQSSVAASERFLQLLDEQPKILPPAQPRPVGQEAGIAFRDVTFHYKEGENVLENVSFTVKPGTTVAIVGHTGAGKTTLTNLLLRFYDVQHGSVEVAGYDVREYDPRQLRSRFGVVLQDPFLFTGTLRDNIRLGDQEINDARIEEAARRVNLWDFIDGRPEGLDLVVQERGGGLSTGQKQLVSFARALVREPQFLILDEATSSVDTETEQRIQEALEEMLKGRTAIVIAHRLSTIQRADKILVMHKGHLKEAGTHQELLKQRGLYWKLYQLQYKDQEARLETARGLV